MNEASNELPPPVPRGVRAGPYDRKGGLARKIVPALAVLLFLGIGSIKAVIAYIGRDIPPPDTTDLVPERMELPPDQNAFTYFTSATNSFYWPTNSAFVTDYLDGKPVDDAVIQELIGRNEAALEMIERGLECQVYLPPEVTGFETQTPYLGPLRNVGRVMAVKVRYEHLAGGYAEATRTCISLLRFGNMIQQDAGCLVHYLLGIAVLELGLTQAQGLASDQTMQPGELTRLSKALANVGPFDHGLVQAIKVEYRQVARIIDQYREGNFSVEELAGSSGERVRSWMKRKSINGYLFQPNKTKLTLANVYRDMIRNAPLPYTSMNRYDVEAALGLNEGGADITRPNVIGRILYALLVPAVDSLLERPCRAECGVAATRLIIACNQYRKAEGKLPDSLQTLLPKYMSSVPADPYDGQPFRYSPSAGIVYSVGKDLKDSGGSAELRKGEKEDNPSRKRWLTEDVVFEINARAEQVPEGDAPKGTQE